MINDIKCADNSNQRLKVHKTGHEIADTVANAFIQDSYDGNADLAYGILRHNIFATSNRWFNVDKGYFNPGHFDGYYRISYKGTQAKWHENIPKQDIEFELGDWRSGEGFILLCPPTDAVATFFNVSNWQIPDIDLKKTLTRYKGDISPIDWRFIKGVVTFNSSVGWQALQRGIPVYSDPNHSIVGSYYSSKLKNPIDFLSDEYKQIDRLPLFKAMRAHQFTLKEISEGKAWPILQHYLSL